MSRIVSWPAHAVSWLASHFQSFLRKFEIDRDLRAGRLRLLCGNESRFGSVLRQRRRNAAEMKPLGSVKDGTPSDIRSAGVIATAESARS